MNWAKVLQFSLKHWKEIAVVLSLLAVTIKTRLDYQALHKAYEISKQETEERIDALQAIHSEEIARREHALEEYKKALEELQDNYDGDPTKEAVSSSIKDFAEAHGGAINAKFARFIK